MARTIEEAKKSGRKICRAIPLFLFYFFSRGKEVNGGESVGFSQPPVELNFTLQGSLFQDVIL